MPQIPGVSFGQLKRALVDSTGRRLDTFEVGEMSYAPRAITPQVATRITIAGDSMAESGMNRTTGVSTDDLVGLVAARASGVTSFKNGGKWGRSAEQTASAQGGAPALLTFPSNQIPASGSVTVTTPDAANPLAGNYDGSQMGSTAGVPATLSWVQATNTLTWTRTTPGSVVPLDGPSRWVPDMATPANRQAITIVEVGRNGAHLVDDNVAAVRRMLAYANGRSVVLDVPPWQGNTDPAATNRAYQEHFPEAYLPLFQWLRTTEAAAAVGYTFTSDDLADIAAGLTPRGFRNTGDGVHWNSRGRWAGADKLGKWLVDQGFIPSFWTPPTLPGTVHALWDFTCQPVGAQNIFVPPLRTNADSADFTQSNTSIAGIQVADPTWKRPSVARFGTDKTLNCTMPTLPGACTVTLVGRIPTIVADKAFMQACGVNLYITGGKFAAYSTSGGTSIISTVNADQLAHVFTLVLWGSSSALWIDGVNVGTGTLTISNKNLLVGTATGQNLQAAALAYYSSVLSDSNIATLHSTLRAAYVA